VLIALRPEDAQWFEWPEEDPYMGTVGTALYELMAAENWPGAERWAAGANGIAPTIVGGSKKHGGADLGPTRAKAAWRALGVDALGVADAPPNESHPVGYVPKLTTEMVARIQGWGDSPEYAWDFTGRKTTRYRQIGNAFPPPVARAVGSAIVNAFRQNGKSKNPADVEEEVLHDPLYVALKKASTSLTEEELVSAAGLKMDSQEFGRRMAHLARDFVIDEDDRLDGRAYRLAGFKGFTGQESHERHARFAEMRSRIS
jgi:DNA (cytosine-5)-methyltransferase 1